MADQVAEDRQWALILVAGGNEAYNRWDTLEETVENREDVEQVWQAFEKSFEQTSSFWHFRDAYLADVRQEDTETTADLDLRIKQIVKGCQWPKGTEEQYMIDLLYHATIYYEIRKYIQEADPKSFKYEQKLTRGTALNTKTIKPHTEEPTARLRTTTRCYLHMPLINVGPVAGVKAISVANVANLMSKETAPLMGELVTNAKVLITLKRCVVQRYQTGQRRALTRNHSNNTSRGECLRAAMAKEEASSSSRRRHLRSIHQSRKRTW